MLTTIIFATLICLTPLVIFLIWKEFANNDFNLPRSYEPPKLKKITIEKNQQKINKKIMETNGLLHTIPLNEIISGGPRKGSIPPIDNPNFVSIEKADAYLSDAEPGIALEINNQARFYPFQILVWHEVVNDTIEEKKIIVTYCPLSFSGAVFDPLIATERVNFGTSGMLWNSNLIMYDKKTNSLWSQILGEAILGEMAGLKLETIPSFQICYHSFKKLYPEGRVLSRETGFFRFYGDDPYNDYYIIPQTFFPISRDDKRLFPKAFILGVMIENRPKAYWIEAIKRNKYIEDKVTNGRLILEYHKNLGLVNILYEKNNGSLEKINPTPCFWFLWASAHPDTEIYR